MADENTGKPPEWLIPNKVYVVLKWIGLIVLPALGTFTIYLGQAWNIQLAVPIAGTITAIGTLIGACIGVTSYISKRGDADD